MYFVRTPGIIKLFSQNIIWEIKGKEKTIYLTFDDGPDIDVTPDVLEILQKFDAKATFFCVGKKAVKHPELIEKIRELGHTIGNHSYSHIHGNRVAVEMFYDDIEKCDMILNSRLFRPPYGKITRTQIEKLRSRYYLILWSVLTGDFDKKVTKEKCLARSVKYTKGGSIIVFHSNLKAKEKVLFVLPQYLEHFSKLGYTFEALSEQLFL